MALKRRHQRTLQRIFTNPAPANILWRDIEALIVALGGEVRQREGSRVAFILNDRVAVFHTPHPHKEATRPKVRSVRAFLVSAGVNLMD